MIPRKISRSNSILKPKSPYFRNKKYLTATTAQPYTLRKAIDDFSQEKDISIKVFLSLIICLLFLGYVGRTFKQAIHIETSNLSKARKEQIAQHREIEFFKDRQKKIHKKWLGNN